jgi:type IV pilus assembly protein PilW
MTPNPPSAIARRHHQGFGLIEILVGLLIGMLAVMVVLQVFAKFEGQKRTTTGGADAATNGAIALHMLEQDGKMAGWGLDESLYLGRSSAGDVEPALPGCATINTYCSGHPSCGGIPGPLTNFSFASILIKDGADGAPDSIAMRFFGNPNVGPYVPSASAVVSAEGPDAAGVPTLKLSSNFGCNQGDLVLISDPTQAAAPACALLQVSAIPPVPAAGATSTTLPHKSGVPVAGVYNDPAWDAGAPGLPLTITPTTLATCFSHPTSGPTFERVYAIDRTKGVLEVTDNTVAPAVTATVVSGIVDLQAQYGVAVDGSQVVSQWTDASRSAGWDKPAPTAAAPRAITKNRLQDIKAVRIAVLSRSSQYEKPNGGVCDATKESPGTPGAGGWSTWATFDTTAYPADWACYRYKAFEIVIPLRNVIWARI